mgnify:FL=1
MVKAPHVFIVNKGLHNYSQAENFGESVIALTQGTCSRVNATKLLRTITPTLADATLEDWLLVSGPPLVNILACCLFVLKHQRLNLLIYASREDLYIQRTLVFD